MQNFSKKRSLNFYGNFTIAAMKFPAIYRDDKFRYKMGKNFSRSLASLDPFLDHYDRYAIDSKLCRSYSTDRIDEIKQGLNAYLPDLQEHTSNHEFRFLCNFGSNGSLTSQGYESCFTSPLVDMDCPIRSHTMDSSPQNIEETDIVYDSMQEMSLDVTTIKDSNVNCNEEELNTHKLQQVVTTKDSSKESIKDEYLQSDSIQETSADNKLNLSLVHDKLQIEFNEILVSAMVDIGSTADLSKDIQVITTGDVQTDFIFGQQPSTSATVAFQAPLVQTNLDPQVQQIEKINREAQAWEQAQSRAVWFVRTIGIDPRRYLEAAADVVGHKNVTHMDTSDRKKVLIYVQRAAAADSLVTVGINIGPSWYRGYRIREKPLKVILDGVPSCIPNASLIEALKNLGTCEDADVEIPRIADRHKTLGHVQSCKRILWFRAPPNVTLPDSVVYHFGGNEFKADVTGEQPKCFKCQGLGHMRRECPLLRMDSWGKPLTMAEVVTQANDQLPTVPVTKWQYVQSKSINNDRGGTRPRGSRGRQWGNTTQRKGWVSNQQTYDHRKQESIITSLNKDSNLSNTDNSKTDWSALSTKISKILEGQHKTKQPASPTKTPVLREDNSTGKPSKNFSTWSSSTSEDEHETIKSNTLKGCIPNEIKGTQGNSTIPKKQTPVTLEKPQNDRATNNHNPNQANLKMANHNNAKDFCLLTKAFNLAMIARGSNVSFPKSCLGGFSSMTAYRLLQQEHKLIDESPQYESLREYIEFLTEQTDIMDSCDTASRKRKDVNHDDSSDAESVPIGNYVKVSAPPLPRRDVAKRRSLNRNK